MGDGCIGAQNRHCMPYTCVRYGAFTVYYNIGQTNRTVSSSSLRSLFPFHTLLVPTYLRIGVEFQCHHTKYRFCSFTNYVRSHLSDAFNEYYKHPYKGEIKLNFENEQR